MKNYIGWKDIQKIHSLDDLWKFNTGIRRKNNWRNVAISNNGWNNSIVSIINETIPAFIALSASFRHDQDLILILFWITLFDYSLIKKKIKVDSNTKLIKHRMFIHHHHKAKNFHFTSSEIPSADKVDTELETQDNKFYHTDSLLQITNLIEQ